MLTEILAPVLPEEEKTHVYSVSPLIQTHLTLCFCFLQQQVVAPHYSLHLLPHEIMWEWSHEVVCRVVYGWCIFVGKAWLWHHPGSLDKKRMGFLNWVLDYCCLLQDKLHRWTLVLWKSCGGEPSFSLQSHRATPQCWTEWYSLFIQNI